MASISRARRSRASATPMFATIAAALVLGAAGVDVGYKTSAPPPARKPATLPGVKSTAPYEYYSGYLNAGTPPSGRGLMFFHYICAMAPNWKAMPLSIWYNGGPGAPSTFGLREMTGESERTDPENRLCDLERFVKKRVFLSSGGRTNAARRARMRSRWNSALPRR